LAKYYILGGRCATLFMPLFGDYVAYCKIKPPISAENPSKMFEQKRLKRNNLP